MRVQINCALPGCETVFFVIPAKAKRSRYCSKEHSCKGLKRSVALVCLYCGAEFTRRPSEITGNRGKFCCFDHYDKYRKIKSKKPIQTQCEFCGKTIPPEENSVKGKNFCNQSCRAKHYAELNSGVIQICPTPEKIIWNQQIGWLLGIIASDGCLPDNESNNIVIVNKDEKLLESVQIIVAEQVTGRMQNLILQKKGKYSWWRYSFYSEHLRRLCIEVGIVPRKSMILEKLDIEDKWFSAFFLGVFDGDGSIGTRKANGRMYMRLRISSGSYEFLQWLKDKCKELFGVKGGSIAKVSQQRKSWDLQFSHYDSMIMASQVYSGMAVFNRCKKNKFLECVRRCMAQDYRNSSIKDSERIIDKSLRVLAEK